MRTRSRKRAVLVTVRGLLLVLIAVVLHASGALRTLESVLADVRVRHCQGTQPQPAESLLHMDVDDNAIDTIGHWPWPSTTMARLVDEIALTRPKVLAMDVIYADRIKVEYGPNDPVGIDGERVLADAFGRLGCALLPVSYEFATVRPPSKVRRLLLPILAADLERTQEDCLVLLRPAGVTAADLDRDPTDSFIRIREAAFYERIWRELSQPSGPPPDLETLRRRLIPNDNPLMSGTVLRNLFNFTYDLVTRELAMARFAIPPDRAGGTRVASAASEKSPILSLARVTRYSGFVDDLRESIEGTVRSVPLLTRYRDRLMPQMGLVAACAVLGANVQDLRLSADKLTIPLPHGAGEVTVPVSIRDSDVVGSVGALMELPLFGRPRDWKTMYDVPQHERMSHHISVVEVWLAADTREKLASNAVETDRLLLNSLALVDPPGLRSYLASRPTGDKLRELIDNEIPILQFRAEPSDPGTVDPPEERTAKENAKRYAEWLPLLRDQGDALRLQLSHLRQDLYGKLHDKAIFFGGTATSLSDIRPTSLFGSTPGVLVHGAVFNAILTGKMWRRAPAGSGVWITAAAGIATLLMTMRLPPAAAFAGSTGLGIGYLAFNGYVLFARHNLIVDAAGPAVAVALVWSLMTLGNYLTEAAERARITRRFRSHVDPKVVDYYLAHPELETIHGERRELTIGFTDLAGFTTLTDELGEEVVPLLADYVGRMIPVVRDNSGTFDKQIGDGLCFFFGAPIPDAVHARQAVRTALAMHEGLAVFNETLKDRGFKPLGMRIGLATGEVIVGNAGAEGAASYTTLGGTTNLASRLEGANKNFGTRTLVTARTVELLGDEYLCRPIANLRVAGKLSCVVVYEPLCVAADATDADRCLATHSAAVFDAYRLGEFAACQQAVEAMEAECGPSKFTRLYADRAAEPFNAADHCGGQIVLTDK